MEEIASDIQEFQFVVPTCEEHSNEELFSYCNTCQERICELCVKGDHNSHDWSTISKHARKIRSEGIKISEQILNEIVPLLRTRTANARQEKNREGILQTKKYIMEKIETYANNLLSFVDEDPDKDHGIEEMIEHFIAIAKFFKENVHSAHDNVVIDMKEEYNIKREEHRQSIKQWAALKNFKKGVIEDRMIKDMFGLIVVGNPDVRLTTGMLWSFTIGTQSIIGVTVTSKDLAWVQQFKSSTNMLLSDAGQMSRQVDFGETYNSFIVKEGIHVFTSREKLAVQKYKDGKVSAVYNTSPLYPTGLSKSKQRGLLVCLIECERSDITHKTKGEVHHIDMAGKIITKYVTDKDRKSSLFIWPNRVAQNVNSDICVLDFIDNKVNDRLVVVSEDSKLRFIYTGQPTMQGRFVAGDVVCDEVGRIFVVDSRNDAIHVLNINGHFLQYIVNADDNIRAPCALSINQDTMWVVCKKGAINIYQIKEE